MTNNANLSAARKAKNDEFYTCLADIENEAKHYTAHFQGKTIYCNCDDPESIRNSRLWLGINNGSHKFRVPDSNRKGTIETDADGHGHRFVTLGNAAWFTNLDNRKRHEGLNSHRLTKRKQHQS